MRTAKIYAIFMAMTIFCLAGAGWAQGQSGGAEKYESKVLITGKWGDKPGEYKYRMWEGDMDWPRSFAVDDNEEVYVLDHLNNRVQHYDKNGKLLGEIPIEFYKLAGRDDIKQWNNGREYPSISIGKILYVDGTLYAVQEERKGQERKKYFLKMQDGHFQAITSTKTRSNVERSISREYQDTLIRQRLKNDKKFKMVERSRKMAVGKGKFSAKTSEEMFYDNSEIQSVFFDKDNNRWVVSNELVRKYNPKGDILFEISDVGSSKVISEQGNLFLMNLYSAKPGDRSQYAIDDYDEGIRIKKFTLVK